MSTAASPARRSVEAAVEVAAGLGGRGTELVRAARSAYVTGMNDAMLVSALVLLAGAAVAALLLPMRSHHEVSQ